MRPSAALLVLPMLLIAWHGVASASPPQTTSSLDVELIGHNTTAAPGGPWSVSWRVNSTAAVDHTNVHWGYSAGTSVQDYPNSASPQQGPAGAKFSSTLVAPLVPGALHLRVHAVAGGQEALSEEFLVLVEHPAKSSTPAVVLVDYPKSAVKPGGNVTITWQVIGGKPGNITHTNVHWGTDPKSQPKETDAQTGVTPQTYTARFQVPGFNTPIYFQLHAVVDGAHVWSSVETFRVGASPDPEITSVTHSPGPVPSGTKLRVAWRIEGGTPGHVERTWVAWDTEAGKLGQATPEQWGKDTNSGTVPADYQDNISVPADAPDLYYKVFAVVDSKVIFYRELNATVIGGANVAAEMIDQPPVRIESGVEFTVSWKIKGGKNVELTRFQYGYESGLPRFQGNEFAGKPDQQFTDILKAPDRQGPVYYTIFYRVDGRNYTSVERDYFVFARGSAANWPVIASMAALVVLLVVLVALLMRQSQRRREAEPDHIPVEDARDVARGWLASRYGAGAKAFRFHDAYQLDDGYDVVFESRYGTFKYKVRIDNARKVRRFSGG